MSVATGSGSSNWVLGFERYASELHDFLDALPGHLKLERVEELRAACRRLIESAPELLAEADERLKAAWLRLRTRLHDLHAALAANSPESAVLERHEELARSYEHWLTALRTGIRALGSSLQTQGLGRSGLAGPRGAAATLKPLIGARTLFHAGMGLVAAVLYQWVLTRGQALVILLSVMGTAVGLEIVRRISPRFNHGLLNSPIFKPIARPSEYHRVNSSTYYLLALCIVTPLFSQPAVVLAILILAFADPAAAWMGKKYGKRKLYLRKSWVGTSAFFATGLVIGGAYLLGCHPELGALRAIGAAGAASLAAAIAELLSTGIDDNLTIPIAAVLAAAALI